MMFAPIIDYLAVSLSVITILRWRLMAFAQKQKYWTLWLRFSLYESYVISLWSISSLGAITKAVFRLNLPGGLNDPSYFLFIVLFLGMTYIFVLDFVYESLRCRRYLRLLWKAWTGPSRTGISPDMVQYVGTADDWRMLARSGLRTDLHPVDRFIGLHSGLILEDPTDLLKARAAANNSFSITQIPQRRLQSGVYQPSANGLAISLLWGENLGFERRCSRGIVSVPLHLLTSSPMLISGLPGEPVCLAFGILSRNKGLEPRTLICNLKSNNSLRQWEEAGIWPHPAKTLRSFYYSEFENAFSLLGDSYITAATELALLIADLDSTLVEEWLDRGFEHQDIELNNLAHANGAGSQDLTRLYRGHYAAMLISLCLSARHSVIRPELIVFDAVCALDGEKIPKWATSDMMESRRQAEQEAYGPLVTQLVGALI